MFNRDLMLLFPKLLIWFWTLMVLVNLTEVITISLQVSVYLILVHSIYTN